MSDASEPKKPLKRGLDISRSSLPAGWLWIAVLLLVGAILYWTFGVQPRQDQIPDGFNWLPFAFFVLAAVALFGGAFFLLQFLPRWKHIAQRPWKLLARGQVAAADQAFEQALAYSQRFRKDDYQRGSMLLELTTFLMNRGRRDEARDFFDETIRVLEIHAGTRPLNYFIALNNYAVFLVAEKNYQAAQEIWESIVDQSPAMKKANTPTTMLDLLLHLNLAYVFVRMNELDEAEAHLQESERLLGTLWRNRRLFRGVLLSNRALWHCAAGRFDDAEDDVEEAGAFDNGNLLWAHAKVEMARGEFAKAEHIYHLAVERLEKLGTSHRPDCLDYKVDLAECLYQQHKHAEAFATFAQARSIVIDFKLPPDDAWRESLSDWRQRARDLNQDEFAAALDAELAQLASVPNQAITVLEKLRISRLSD